MICIILNNEFFSNFVIDNKEEQQRQGQGQGQGRGHGRVVDDNRGDEETVTF